MTSTLYERIRQVAFPFHSSGHDRSSAAHCRPHQGTLILSRVTEQPAAVSRSTKFSEQMSSSASIESFEQIEAAARVTREGQRHNSSINSCAMAVHSLQHGLRGEVSFIVHDPDRLGERSIGGDVPDLKSNPGRVGQIDRCVQCLAVKGAGLAQIDPFAMDGFAIAADHFGKAQGKGPVHLGP